MSASRRLHQGGPVAGAHAARTKLERRIEAIYEDKLDGVIDEAFYRRKTEECQTEMDRLTQEIERQQKTGRGYLDNLADLAARAAGLLERQTASEERGPCLTGGRCGAVDRAVFGSGRLRK